MQRASFPILAMVLAAFLSACARAPKDESPPVPSPTLAAYGEYYAAASALLEQQQAVAESLEAAGRKLYLGDSPEGLVRGRERVSAVQAEIATNDLALDATTRRPGEALAVNDSARMFFLLLERFLDANPRLQNALEPEFPELRQFSSSKAAATLKRMFASEKEAKQSVGFAAFEKSLQAKEAELLEKLSAVLARYDASLRAPRYQGAVDGIADIRLGSSFAEAAALLSTRCASLNAYKRGLGCPEAIGLFGEKNDLFLVPADLPGWQSRFAELAQQQGAVQIQPSSLELERHTVAAIVVANVTPAQAAQIESSLVQKYGGSIFESRCFGASGGTSWRRVLPMGSGFAVCPCIRPLPSGEVATVAGCSSVPSLPTGYEQRLSFEIFANGQIELGWGENPNLTYRSTTLGDELVARLNAATSEQDESIAFQPSNRPD